MVSSSWSLPRSHSRGWINVQRGHLPGLTELGNDKGLGRNPRPFPGSGKMQPGFLDTLVGELEGSEMDTHAPGGAEEEVGLDRLLRIDMGRGHEPTRLIGPDGQEREPDGSERVGDQLEMPVEPGISGKIHRAGRRTQDE